MFHDDVSTSGYTVSNDRVFQKLEMLYFTMMSVPRDTQCRMIECSKNWKIFGRKRVFCH